jgi:hypothetical protein
MYFFMISMIALSAASPLEQKDEGSTEDVQHLHQWFSVRRANIKDVEVHIDYENKFRKIRGTPLLSESQHIDFSTDFINKLKAQIIYDSKVKEIPNKTTTYSQINNLHYESSKALDERMLIRISSQSDFIWSLHPVKFLNLNRWFIPDYLKNTAQTTEPGPIVDNYATIKLNWLSNPDEGKADQRKGYILVCRDLGYSVLRSEYFRRPTEAMEWKSIESDACSDYVKVNETWFPRSASHTRHSYYADGGYELSQELIAKFSEWKVNQGRSDLDYKPTFPDGTLVIDETKNGLSYIVGKITNRTLKEDTKQLLKIFKENKADEETHTNSRSRLAYALGSSFVCCLVVILVLFLRRKYSQ